MIEIEPFSGIVYNQKKVNLAKVVTPPYDMIRPEQIEEFYKRSPYNIIRLILGRPNHKGDWFERAATCFKKWMKEGILERHIKRGIYPYYIRYTKGGKERCLKGFIARLRLEPFNKGNIYPHEQTFNEVVSERLKLLKACQANFSQVFGLYSDVKNKVIEAIEGALPSSPFIEIETEGTRHCVWQLTNEHIISEIKLLMHDKKLIIADGHHRYQTALAYKEEMNALFPNAPRDASFNYTSVYLSNLEDPGLDILPTHRLLANGCIPNFRLDEFFKKISKIFKIMCYNDQKTFWKTLREIGKYRTAIGFYFHGYSGFFIFVPKEAMGGLDVTVLTESIIKGILNLEESRLGEEIYYVSRGEEAIDLVKKGKYKMAFLLNPTKVSQLKEVISRNQLMPPKSTHFYPKILTGLIINSLKDE